MIPTVRAFLLSVLFSLVFLLESEGAPSNRGRSDDEGAPVEDALQVVLQGLSLLQEETRQEWKEALRLLEKRTQEEMQRRDAEVKALVEGLVLRIRDVEKRVSALDQDTLECAGGREDFERLNGRLSRLEECLQRAVDGCSPAGAPPTPASSTIPSARSSVSSSTTYLSSHTSSSTSNATTNYTSTSAATASSNSTIAPPSASSPVSSSTPSTPNTAAFRTPTPAPPPSEASAPLPTSAARAAPPTADPALRRDLGKELNNAAREGNMQEVERLLNDGADPNYATAMGYTPLMAASRNGHAPVVSLLLRRGADVHAADSDGWTALHYAAFFDHSGRAVPLLVAAGARVHSRDRWGKTPLHVAADWDNEEAVRALLAAGASKTLKDYEGRIPLDRATSDAVRRLLRP